MERRNIGLNGLKVITYFEGERKASCGWIAATQQYKPYLDPVGIPTIGVGTIAYPNGARVKMTDRPISESYALDCLNFELDEKEDAVMRFMQKTGLELSTNQFDAIVSMAYNCGIGILESGTTLRTALLTKNLTRIEVAMMAYTKATQSYKIGPFTYKKKVVLKGLVNRRKTEFELFALGSVHFYS